MKVKVNYTKIVEKVVEIDEKFYILTEPNSRTELSRKEYKALTDECLDDIIDCVGIDDYHDIIAVEVYDTEELIYGA